VSCRISRVCQCCPTPEVFDQWRSLLQHHSQMPYLLSQMVGQPIDSGMVASANTAAAEVCLKGTGLYGKRENVNPMLTLHYAFCSDCWDKICQTYRSQGFQHQIHEQKEHRQTYMEHADAQILRFLLLIPLSSPHLKEEARAGAPLHLLRSRLPPTQRSYQSAISDTPFFPGISVGSLEKPCSSERGLVPGSALRLRTGGSHFLREPFLFLLCLFAPS
jgi:hypothetical protein